MMMMLIMIMIVRGCHAFVACNRFFKCTDRQNDVQELQSREEQAEGEGEVQIEAKEVRKYQENEKMWRRSTDDYRVDNEWSPISDWSVEKRRTTEDVFLVFGQKHFALAWKRPHKLHLTLISFYNNLATTGKTVFFSVCFPQECFSWAVVQPLPSSIGALFLTCWGSCYGGFSSFFFSWILSTKTEDQMLQESVAVIFKEINPSPRRINWREIRCMKMTRNS